MEGDSIQIAIDALGDSTQGLPVQARGPFGTDDIAFAIALTSEGPTGWMYFSDASLGLRGKMQDSLFSVSREDTITHYTIEIPWETLQTDPNLSPTLGLAVQLNDVSPAGDERAYFGKGADGSPRPGLHETLIKPQPQHSIYQARLNHNIVIDPTKGLLANVDVFSLSDTLLKIELDNHVKEWPLVGQEAWHQLSAQVIPSDRSAESLKVAILDAQSEQILYSESWSISYLDSITSEFIDHLDSLIAQPENHPLFNRHLRSVKAIVMSEWGRLETYRENSERVLNFVEKVQNMYEAFQADAGEWEAYLDGRRSLVMAYTSPHDGTLQFYNFCLPDNWDPDKAYPLFFELHGGGGNPSAMRISNRLSLEGAKSDLSGYSAPKTYAEIQRNGYWVHPYGRGNLGHQGIAEITMFEAYEDAHKHFKIDPTRRYLYGFSMGGGGTFANAMRTPDKWAAIAILSGAPRSYPTIDVVKNLQNTPIWIWCGELDRLLPRYHRMVEQLEAAGVKEAREAHYAQRLP